MLLADVQSASVSFGCGGRGAFELAAGLTVLQWIGAGDALAAGRHREPRRLLRLDHDGRIRHLLPFGADRGHRSRADDGVAVRREPGPTGAEAIALVLLATTGSLSWLPPTTWSCCSSGSRSGPSRCTSSPAWPGKDGESEEAAIKYFLLGSFASAVFVYGVALIYAGTGQFEILGIRQLLDDFVISSPAVIYIGIGLVVAGLGFKVSAAPFHTWAPDVYQGAPAGLVGYMAAVAKVAGFAAIARILLTAFSDLADTWLPVVAGVSVLSMVFGSVLALVQGDVRRLLAYSGVAHAGFIMTGVVGGATDGVLFYLAIYAIQLVGAFAVVAVVSGPTEPAPAWRSTAVWAGEARSWPAPSPSSCSGWGVFPSHPDSWPVRVFTDAWAQGYQWLVIVAVIASVVAFAFYIRVIVVMYMDDAGEEKLYASRS